MSQESDELSILSTDRNWVKEIIQFPIDWAPDLKLTGFEELRFAPKWSDSLEGGFWSLVMAWEVEATKALTSEEIELNFRAYFDGLMIPNHWATTFPKPMVLFVPVSTDGKKNTLVGKMKFFDGFHTGKLTTVNIKVETHFCKVKNRAVTVFRISPQKLDHEIWSKLFSITYADTDCE